MNLRPTRRLPGMLVAALVIYVFATNSQVVWLYLVAALVGGLAVIGLLAPWLTVRRLRPRLAGHSRSGFVPPLAQDRDRVFDGDEVTLRIELGEARSPVELVDLRGADGSIVPIQAQSWLDTGVTARITATRRGLMRLAAVTVASSWPLGIARARREVRLDFEVMVHPRYVLPAEARRHGSREPAGITASRGQGDEFLGLREYRSGDSQRRVHWPTTARTGTLMVVETARESSNSSAYALDLGGDSGEAAELAVRVAASLGAGNVAAGIPLMMSVPGQPRHVQRWPEIIAALARAQPGDASAGRIPREAVRISAGAGQVTVTRGEATVVLDAGLDLEAALGALEQG
jgi:uncharacterized protein (DUF58 family)